MSKRFLTLFPQLRSQYLMKDVGAIPYHLSKSYGWSTTVAYLEEEGNCIEKRSYQEYVQIISIGVRRNSIINALMIVSFLLRNSVKYDVLNLYHESFANVILGYLFKWCNPNGIVYVKLDLGLPFIKFFNKEKNTFWGKIKQYIRYRISESCVGLYTVETNWGYNLLKKDTYFAGRIMKLTNGISLEGFNCGVLDVKNKENIILFVGNIGAYAKNCELLVEAVASLNENITKNWKLYLVGPIVNANCYETGSFTFDDNFIHFLDEIYQKHPVMKQVVVMTGEISDRIALSEIYSKTKIFCMPSRYESFGFVLLEAMYFNNYIITTDIPLVADLMGNGAIGRVVTSNDCADIAAAIERAICEWDRKIAVNVRNNRKLVLQHYDWIKITGLLGKRLELLLTNGK